MLRVRHLTGIGKKKKNYEKNISTIDSPSRGINHHQTSSHLTAPLRQAHSFSTLLKRVIIMLADNKPRRNEPSVSWRQYLAVIINISMDKQRVAA